MGRPVGVVEIGHDERRALPFRQSCQTEGFLHAAGIIKAGFIVPVFVIRGQHAADRDVASHPIDTGGGHTLFFGRRPDGLAAIIVWPVAGGRIAHGIHHPAFTVPKRAVHDAMMIGNQSGREGIMVREGRGRVGGFHYRLNAGAADAVQPRGVVDLREIPSERIQGHHHRQMAFYGSLPAGGQRSRHQNDGPYYLSHFRSVYFLQIYRCGRKKTKKRSGPGGSLPIV